VVEENILPQAGLNRIASWMPSPPKARTVVTIKGESHDPAAVTAAKESHREGGLRIALGRRHGRSVRHRRLGLSPERSASRDEGVL
jgi:hypothetical protein